ncbi:MAG: hypothetical protein E7055_05785 [Lentisphaerae bacterium]|nr:hypothetical protein [Lentisphaerota bacterium]
MEPGRKKTDWLKERWFYCFAAAVAAIVYLLLFDRYLLNDIDDTWTTAWVYYFIHDGQTKDLVFMEQVPEYWGVRFFSHLFCWIYGGFLSLIGFTRANVHLLSNFFMFAGFGCWYWIGKRIWKSKEMAFELVLLLAMSTLFLGAANKGRSDAFIFFLQSASLLLFTGQYYFSSVLVLCLAVETHPIGIMGGCYLAAYAASYDRELFRLKNWKALLRIAAGGFAGFGFYLLMHHSELFNISDLSQVLDAPSNFLYMHFFGRGHFPWRYWPDLFLFAAAAIWIVHSCLRDKKLSFPLNASVFLLLASFLIRRGNFHYALFCYPAFLMLAEEAFGKLNVKKIPLLLLFWIGLQLPQFCFLYYKNASCRDYDVYLNFLSDAGFPSDSIIYGQPADWFGLQKYRKFRSLTHFHPPKSKFYLIEHHETRYQQPDLKPVAPEGFRLTVIRSIRLPSGGEICIKEAVPSR